MVSGSSDAGNVCPGPAASILLLEEGYLFFAASRNRNATTATTRSRANHTVEVTLWVADPPAVSFFTLHCIRSVPISKYIDDDERGFHAVVAGTHGNILLIRTLLSRFGECEYFVYKSHPESPSLESIPPNPFGGSLNGTEFGIVPRDDGHYLLVALRSIMVKGQDYGLFIYSSESRAWMAKELRNPCPELRKVLATKVFTLGDGSLLFVDLLKGMLTFDLDLCLEPHRVQYIPLPEPLPGNREKLKKYTGGVEFFRDLTCVDGRLIKFIDMEHRVIVSEIVPDVPPEEPVDPRTKDVFYDSELIMLSKRKLVEMEIKPKLQQSPDGWSATLWTREIGSNCWLKGSDVDVNDILFEDFPALLSSNSESAGSLTIQDLNCVRPTLSVDGNDILYLKFTCGQSGVPGVAAVDLVEKTLKVEAPAVHTVGKHPPLKQILHPCALAKQLEITPGIKVSANLIAQMRRSANEPKPNSTAIRVGEPDSYESENKRPRHLAEEDNHAQTGAGAQSTVQNVLISQAQPIQNNMPPSLCVNRYQHPGYSGYSSWPHQNNPRQPSSYFNEWARPYNPVYAPLTHPTNIQSYANYYQSLPQQPILQEQQTTPSVEFGPYMARPNQHFNNWYGASSYGIGSGVNEYAFGADSGSGLYHQR